MDSTRIVAFGSGVLQGNTFDAPTVFFIQAKDKISVGRTCGMDEFAVDDIPYIGEEGSDAHLDPPPPDSASGLGLVKRHNLEEGK